MKNCPNCRSQVKDEAIFCPVCGTMMDVVSQPSAEYFRPATQEVPPPVPVIAAPDLYDHTDDFSQEDILESKLACMCVYLLDFIGVIIALLMCSSSPYARFHIRQSLKFTVLEILITIASVLLCWTIIIPIAGAVSLLILLILKLICFAAVCNGLAKDAPIIRNLKFLN